jgi:putative ABC transport system permease protein
MPWTDFRRDLIYSLRSLRRSPGFTIVALLTLGLGIGANTAIFSIVDAVLLRPLPFHDADRLVFLWSTGPSSQRDSLTPARLRDFAEQMTTVTALASLSHLSVNLTDAGDPERVSASSVSSGFFDVLGVASLIGDTFHTSSTPPRGTTGGGNPGSRVDQRDVVLSYGLWTRRFAADPTIVGRDITINGTSRRVVAVMPSEFQWPAITSSSTSNAPAPELWLPGNHQDVPRTPKDDPTEDLATRRGGSYLRAVARLADGVSTAQAQREAEAIATRLAALYPTDEGGRSAALQPIRDQLFGTVERPLLILLGAVGFVLAIACANAASLLLGRAAVRRKEIVVRLALGAGRARLVRQLLTEATILAFGGACFGLLLAWWGKTWLVAAAPAGILRVDDAAIDGRVLAFTTMVALATGILFGIVPALQASTGALNEDLAEGSTRTSATRRTGRSRDLLVVAEISVALVLLLGAGLLLRSFIALSRVDTGIAARNLLTFDIVLRGRAYDSDQSRLSFYNGVLRSLSGLPGVSAAAGAVTLPIGGDNFGTGVQIEGQPIPRPGQELRAGYRIVTPNYFRTMGIPVRAGRDFRDSDTRDSAPVVIVNETFARHLGVPAARSLRGGVEVGVPAARSLRGGVEVGVPAARSLRGGVEVGVPAARSLRGGVEVGVPAARLSRGRVEWPGRDAIGRRVRFGPDDSDPWMTVIGIVGDVRHQGPGTPPVPEIYEPAARRPFSGMTFVIRTAGASETLATPIRKVIAQLDPAQPMTRPTSMDEHLARSLARPRFLSTLVAGFAALALTLSVVGIYGIMSYSVAQRTREIAIRTALGAQPGDVMRLVLSKALQLSVVGSAIGLTAAASLTRVLSSQLFGVTASDPLTYLVVVGLLLVLALVAGAVPAWRALRIESASALRFS